MAGAFKCRNESFCSTKLREFLEWLKTCYLLRKPSAVRNWLVKVFMSVHLIYCGHKAALLSFRVLHFELAGVHRLNCHCSILDSRSKQVGTNGRPA